MGRRHLLLRRQEWAFGGVAVGKSLRMSMGLIDLCICRLEWAFGGVALGKRQWVSGRGLKSAMMARSYVVAAYNRCCPSCVVRGGLHCELNQGNIAMHFVLRIYFSWFRQQTNQQIKGTSTSRLRALLLQGALPYTQTLKHKKVHSVRYIL